MVNSHSEIHLNIYKIIVLIILFKEQFLVDNFITLTIIGPGSNISILNSKYNTLPHSLYINDSPIEPSKQIDLVKEGENIVKLKWNTKLKTAYQMFYGCTSLISADLSNFDITGLTKSNGIAYIFDSCPSLKYVNLSGLRSILLTSLYGILSGCISLTSIDITNVYFPKLDSLRLTFQNCASLISLDLSILNDVLIDRIEYLFSGDSYLILLDLSTNKIIPVNGYRGNEFTNCNKLK